MTTPATPATTASGLAAPFVLKLTASGETLQDIETTLERILSLIKDGYDGGDGRYGAAREFSWGLTENLPV
jgi:hypothetical protein